MVLQPLKTYNLLQIAKIVPEHDWNEEVLEVIAYTWPMTYKDREYPPINFSLTSEFDKDVI